MADTTNTPTETTTTVAADTAMSAATSDDAILSGEASQEAFGQAGLGEERPLSDETQLVDDVAPGDNFQFPEGIAQNALQLEQAP